MEPKQTNSVIQPPIHTESINVSIESPHQGVQSENAMQIQRRKKQRVPLALQSVLRDKMSEKRSSYHPDP